MCIRDSIYVDRATTARKDVEKRLHFQEMIRDSEKRPWEYVVVWTVSYTHLGTSVSSRLTMIPSVLSWMIFSVGQS